MVVAADTAAAVNVAQAAGEAWAADQTDPPDRVEVAREPALDAGSRQARPLTDLTERALAAFGKLGSLTEPPPPAVGGDGPIRITLTLGRITGCSIEPRWLAQADRSGLGAALHQALAAARSAHREARRPLDELNRDLADLLTEVKTTLRTYPGGV